MQSTSQNEEDDSQEEGEKRKQSAECESEKNSGNSMQSVSCVRRGSLTQNLDVTRDRVSHRSHRKDIRDES